MIMECCPINSWNSNTTRLFPPPCSACCFTVLFHYWKTSAGNQFTFDIYVWQQFREGGMISGCRFAAGRLIYVERILLGGRSCLSGLFTRDHEISRSSISNQTNMKTNIAWVTWGAKLLLLSRFVKLLVHSGTIYSVWGDLELELFLFFFSGIIVSDDFAPQNSHFCFLLLFCVVY